MDHQYTTTIATMLLAASLLSGCSHTSQTQKESRMTIQRKEIPARVFLASKRTLTIPEIPAFSQAVLGDLFKEASKLGLTVTGPVEFIYFGCTGNPETRFDLYIAIPVKDKAADAGRFEYYESAAFECVYQDYVGSMKGIGNAWSSFIGEAEQSGIVYHDQNHIREVYKKWVDFESDENVTELQAQIR